MANFLMHAARDCSIQTPMGYYHPRQPSPYLQGNVQGGQPQGSRYNNQWTSRSHSLQPSVQTNATLNHSLSANLSPVSGQAQPFDTYGTGQNRELGLQYVLSTNTPQYIDAQGQIQSASYQDPSQTYQSAEQYFLLEGQPSHLVSQHVSQQNRTHQFQSPPQQPSVPHNPSRSVQGQYPQYQHGDVEYSTGHLQQWRFSSSQYPQQQPSTQPYSQHQQLLPPQQGRQPNIPFLRESHNSHQIRQSHSTCRDTRGYRRVYG
ncbi:hypothetical protein F5888DRAFT_1774854 [Russula emetica]|nr:hypothetical protein F5888DRAFT_1774854 [Russula emetica]